MCFPCRYYIMQTKITLGLLPETRASEYWLLQFLRMVHASGQLSESHSAEAGKCVLVRNLESQGQNLILVWKWIRSCWGACFLSLLELFLIKKIRG